MYSNTSQIHGWKESYTFDVSIHRIDTYTIQSTVDQWHFFYYVTASKYDFPSVPMKLLNTTNMTRKQKDKIRKKQEKLDRTLETIGIEEKQFLEVFRDRPMEVMHILLFLAKGVRYSKKKFGCCNALGSSGGLLLETDICAIEHTYCSFKNAAYTMLVFLYHSIRWFFLGGGMSSLGKFVIFYLKIDSPYEIIIQEEGSWQHSGLLAISIPLSWFIDKLGTNM